MQRYDKISEARNGLAVVPISGTGCGGCGAFVPPQIISEVKQKIIIIAKVVDFYAGTLNDFLLRYYFYLSSYELIG